MASHAERMKQSRCFIETTAAIAKDNSKKKDLFTYKNAMTCVTCHNPHVSRLETSANVFNQACGNCHGAGQTQCSEKMEIRIKKNDNCVQCHMPEHGTVDIPHVRVHDHKIQKPVEGKTLAGIKKFIGITAINNPSPPPSSLAEAYLNYFEKFGLGSEMLDSAWIYINRIDAKQSVHLKVRYHFLKMEYAKLVQLAEENNLIDRLNSKNLNNSDAWTAYRVADAFRLTGNLDKSERYFKRCYELAPLDPAFVNEYGEILAQNGKYREAARIFSEVNKMHPGFAAAYANLGFVYLSAFRDPATALKLYDQALALDPDQVTGLLNKAALMMIQGNKDSAIKLLKHVIKKDPQNQKARMALMQLQEKI
jgi:Tfp pilus assembly protein PilF